METEPSEHPAERRRPAPRTGRAATVLALIERLALDPRADVQKLERMMAMYERLNAIEAELAYNAAKGRILKKLASIKIDMRLNGCGLLVHGIGAECGADDGARRAATLGLYHEFCDHLGDVVRVWGIGRLERRHQALKHSAGNLADCSVGRCTVGVGRLLNVRIHWGRIGARLDQRDVDAELRDLVTEAVSERLDCKLAGAVDTEEWEGHAAEDRADIDDQPVTLSAHSRQHLAGCA